MRMTKGVPVRLAPLGTRVVVIKQGTPAVSGAISEVRHESHLKTYVVTCDDGSVVYASAHDLAREDDGTRSPLGPTPEY